MNVTLNFQTPSAKGDIKRLGNVHSAARGYSCYELCISHQGLTLAITADFMEADRLREEVSFFAAGSLPILSLPDWETLPYDRFSPHQDIISQRITSLNQLASQEQCLLIVPLPTLLHRLAPRNFICGRHISLSTGQSLDSNTFRRKLLDAGYLHTDNVYEHGEFSIRGAIIDLFPMGSPLPYRIELFDDEIDTLRTFDPETQRSLKQTERIELLPAKEFPTDEAAISQFKARWRETFDLDFRQCPTYQDISEGIFSPGIEYYQPLFFEQMETLFDYIPNTSHCFFDMGLADTADKFWQEVQERYQQRRHD